MKSNIKILVLALVLCVALSCLVACNDKSVHDYAGDLKLDMSSTSLKMEVTVKSFIDGDTTHFYVPKSDDFPTGVLKARYLAINTPESTGKVESYGKAASRFTKSKLKDAVSIIVESEDNHWNVDSTGARHLVWVWYKPSEGADYRNLNLEILQNGLAIGSSTRNNKYGEICMNALNEATAAKINVFSNIPDPEMYTGEILNVELKDLRANLESYEGARVAFEGVVTMSTGGSAYIEEYYEADDLCSGISVYYGTFLSAGGEEILAVGNRVKVVGLVQYWETGGTYQIADVQYLPRKPNDPGNLQLISTGHEAKYKETSPADFVDKMINIVIDNEPVEFEYAELARDTTISMSNLKVESVYTTKTGDNMGAMTFTCKSGEHTIYVRTGVLKDADGNVITEDVYLGKTISVKGIVEYYLPEGKTVGQNQIKVLDWMDITDGQGNVIKG